MAVIFAFIQSLGICFVCIDALKIILSGVEITFLNSNKFVDVIHEALQIYIH